MTLIGVLSLLVVLVVCYNHLLMAMCGVSNNENNMIDDIAMAIVEKDDTNNLRKSDDFIPGGLVKTESVKNYVKLKDNIDLSDALIGSEKDQFKYYDSEDKVPIDGDQVWSNIHSPNDREEKDNGVFKNGKSTGSRVININRDTYVAEPLKTQKEYVNEKSANENFTSHRRGRRSSERTEDIYGSVPVMLSYEKKEGKNYIYNYTTLLKEIYHRQPVKYQISPFDYNLNGEEAITLKFTPFKILSVNEKEQSVSIASYVYIKWSDDALKWDPSKYNNITNINLKTEEIWTPSIIIPQANGDGFVLRKPDYVSVNVEKNDNVKLSTLFKFTTACELDLSVFPFDTQSCSILFRDENGRPMTAKDRDNYTDFIIDMEESSGEWDIVKKEVYTIQASKICDDMGDSVMYTIIMARRSTFYVANLLIPLHMTSFVALFVFWIPPETGEKISFMVSMYVSTAMYLSFINDVLPHSLIRLPAFNIITVCINIQIALTFIASLLVLRQYRHQLENNSSTTRLFSRSSISSSTTSLSSYLNPKDQTSSPKPSASPLPPVDSDLDVKPNLPSKKPKLSKNAVAPIGNQAWSCQRYEENPFHYQSQSSNLGWLDYRFLDKVFFVIFTIAFILILTVPWLIKI